jgi:hypothetical protein
MWRHIAVPALFYQAKYVITLLNKKDYLGAMGYSICTQCHAIGKPARKKRGSGKVEFFLWMSFPFNIPYTLWRMLTKYNVCSGCGSQNLIAEDSIIGQRLLAKMEEGSAPILGAAKRLEREAVPLSPLKQPSAPVATPQPVAVTLPTALEEEKAFFEQRKIAPIQEAVVPSHRTDPESF